MARPDTRKSLAAHGREHLWSRQLCKSFQILTNKQAAHLTVCGLFSGFLNKAFSAAGAGNIYLALSFRYTEIVFAAGTLKKAKIPALTHFILLAAEKVFHLIPMLHKYHVFPPAFFQVAGDHAEYAKNYEYCRKR